MKRIVALSFSLLFALGLHSQPVVRITADPWMPFTGDGKSSFGYIVDVAKAIYEPAGFKVEYSVNPWARALLETKTGTYDLIAGATSSDGKDVILPATTLGVSRVAYFVKAGSKWKWEGIDSLKKAKLGVIKGYTYYPELDEYIAANERNPERISFTFGTNGARDQIDKVLSGAVDVIVDFDSVIRHAALSGAKADAIRQAGAHTESDSVYLALSPKAANRAELERLLAEGLDRLRKTGKLAAILDAYGLKDWK